MRGRPVPATADRTRPQPQPTSLRDFRWPLTLIVLSLIGLAAYLITVAWTRDALDNALERVEGIAEDFQTGTITTTFLAALPELTPIPGGNLEVASAKMTETLIRSDEKRLFWDYVSLGETVTEAKVPVTYRYHLRLNDPWRLEISGRTCIVRAPKIRPSLPPAVHLSEIERRVETGWLRFDGREQLDALEKSIIPSLEAYASDPRHLNLVRDSSRRSVADFVRNWLLKEKRWSADGVQSIIVVFADEEFDDSSHFQPVRIEEE